MNRLLRKSVTFALLMCIAAPASAHYVRDLTVHPDLSEYRDSQRGQRTRIDSLRKAGDVEGLLRLAQSFSEHVAGPAKIYLLAECAYAFILVGDTGSSVEIMTSIREMCLEEEAEDLRYLVDLGIATAMAQEGHRSHRYGFNPSIDEKAEAFGRIFREYYPYQRDSLNSQFEFITEALHVSESDHVRYGAYTILALRTLDLVEQRALDIQEYPRLASDRDTFGRTDYYLERVAERRPKIERRLDSFWEHVLLPGEEEYVFAKVEEVEALFAGSERDWVGELLASEKPEPTALSEPSTWIEYSDQPLRFLAPSELSVIPVQGIDSLVRQFEIPGQMLLSFDYGWYSGDLRGHRKNRNYIHTTIEIDGRVASMATWYTDEYDSYPFKVAIHVSEVKPPGELGMATKLTFGASCRTESVREFAERILQSTRFP